MTLDDAAGCPGQYIRTQNRTAGICYGCERHLKPGQQLAPVAAMTAPGGEWDCPNWRSWGQAAVTAGA